MEDRSAETPAPAIAATHFHLKLIEYSPLQDRATVVSAEPRLNPNQRQNERARVLVPARPEFPANLMRVFDSHIHLDKVAPSNRGAGPSASCYHALVPGITPEQTLDALMDASLESAWFAAALHPWSAMTLELLPNHDLRMKIETVAHDARVHAIGETGLDALRVKSASDRDRAMDWFVWHVELAARLRHPLVIHSVRTHAEVAGVLERIRPERGGVIHAFSGSPEEAARFERVGFRVGIGSAVTRERSRRVRHAASAIPDHQLLVETDAPYMSTGQHAGGAADILDVIDTVATLRDTTPEEIAEITWANAITLFGAEGSSTAE